MFIAAASYEGRYRVRLRLEEWVGIEGRKTGGTSRWTCKWAEPEQRETGGGVLMT